MSKSARYLVFHVRSGDIRQVTVDRTDYARSTPKEIADHVAPADAEPRFIEALEAAISKDMEAELERLGALTAPTPKM